MGLSKNICVYSKDDKLLKYSLEEKIVANYETKEVNTCLLVACRYNNNIEIIEYLIKKCAAGVNYETNEGNNCLLIACRYNNSTNIIRYLIKECGMNINYTNNNEENCLTMACMNNIELV